MSETLRGKSIKLEKSFGKISDTRLEAAVVALEEGVPVQFELFGGLYNTITPEQAAKMVSLDKITEMLVKNDESFEKEIASIEKKYASEEARLEDYIERLLKIS